MIRKDHVTHIANKRPVKAASVLIDLEAVECFLYLALRMSRTMPKESLMVVVVVALELHSTTGHCRDDYKWPL